MCGEPHTSFSRYWWVTTLPACCASSCSSRYSFGVSVTRVPLSVTIRAARSMVSGPVFTTGSPVVARTWRRIAACAREQLRHAERLHHIIVGTALQETHLLGF